MKKNNLLKIFLVFMFLSNNLTAQDVRIGFQKGLKTNDKHDI